MPLDFGKISQKASDVYRKVTGGGRPSILGGASGLEGPPVSAATGAAKNVGLLGKIPKGLKVAGGAGLFLGAVDLLLDPAAEVGAGVFDQVNPSRVDRRLERMISGQEKVDQFERMRAKRDRKVAELMQRNTMLLATQAPHLFNQLMAGRSLPRGATVIGGQPRTDLVEEVAMGMTQGRFAPPAEGELPFGGE